MRPIKFREWDSVRQEIYQPDCNWGMSYSYRTDSDDSVEFRFRHMESDEDWEDDDQGEPRRVLEQYTGLKDKNGQEIYEGDILATSSVIKGHNITDYLNVEWREDYGGFYCSEDPLFTCLSKYDRNTGYSQTFPEIVGNIHENPELLEVDQ